MSSKAREARLAALGPRVADVATRAWGCQPVLDGIVPVGRPKLLASLADSADHQDVVAVGVLRILPRLAPARLRLFRDLEGLHAPT
ncbi:unnamed protein product, partial [Polarella glacialis]